MNWFIVGLLILAIIGAALLYIFARRDEEQIKNDEEHSGTIESEQNKNDHNSTIDETGAFHVGQYPPDENANHSQFDPEKFLARYQNIETWGAILVALVLTVMVVMSAINAQHQLDACVSATGWVPSVVPGQVK
jgi:hypothetical protein